jgi:long-chain fatty acid transport protein
MKRVILLSTISAVALFATNGDSLIGLGAKARGMGGVGIATYFGAENALSNPALLSKSTGFEFDFGATYFSPKVTVNGSKSKADTNMIPEISISSKVNDKISYGIGMFGSAGMGVDFRDSGNNDLFKSRTNLLLMKIAPSISYKVNNNFSIGFAPIIQYGALQISYHNGASQIGNGTSDDFGLGYEFGGAYDIDKNSRIGFVYKSAIDMKYKDQISKAGEAFMMTLSDHLEQPEEYGIGYSYDYGNYTFAFDYKKIKWSDAKGYKEFGWDDQNVYAFGAKYEANGTWYSVGYNYAKTPLKEQADVRFNTFNYMMFPATAEKHYTFGYGRKLTKNLSIGLNIVYAPETTKTVTGTNGMSNFPIETKHSETSSTISFKYNF